MTDDEALLRLDIAFLAVDRVLDLGDGLFDGTYTFRAKAAGEVLDAFLAGMITHGTPGYLEVRSRIQKRREIMREKEEKLGPIYDGIARGVYDRKDFLRLVQEAYGR